MSSHIAHVRNEEGRPLLCDGCPRCEEQAENVGIHLDPETWWKAWSIMLGVEYGDDSYQSDAEAKLGRSLYHVSLVTTRATGIPPQHLFEDRLPTTERS